MRREIGRIARMRMYRMLLFYLPLAAFRFFALFFSKGVLRNIPIAVVDDDRTALSRKLVEMLDAAPTAYVAYVAPSMNEAERLMREGRNHGCRADSVRLRKGAARRRSNAGRSLYHRYEYHSQRLTVERHPDRRDDLFGRRAGATAYGARHVRRTSDGPNHARSIQSACVVQSLHQLRLLSGAELHAHDVVDIRGHGDGVRGRYGAQARHGTRMAQCGRRFDDGGLDRKTAACDGDAAVAGFRDAVHSDSNRRRTTERKLYCHAGRNVLFLLGYQAIAVLIVALMANMRLSLSLSGGYSVLAFTFRTDIPDYGEWAPMRWLSLCFPFTYYTDLFIDQMMRGAPVVYSLSDLGYMALFMLLPLLVLPRLRKSLHGAEILGRA